jgi:glycyl-tRNA synthetase
MPARSIEQIRNLSRRRGFVFPGSAAYGGLGSFWDYGPLGVELLNNIKQAWWNDVVYQRDDVEGLDAAILMSRKVWQHSGHEATFSDPLVDNKKTGKRYRLDHLLEQQSSETLSDLFRRVAKLLRQPEPLSLVADVQTTIPEVCALLVSPDVEIRIADAWQLPHRFEGASLIPELRRHARGGEALSISSRVMEKFSAALLEHTPSKAAGLAVLLTLQDALDARAPGSALEWNYMVAVLFAQPVAQRILSASKVRDPSTGEPGEWTEPRRFNLMFQSHVGPVSASPDTEEELASRVYLRPETAQGIFLNFNHVQRSMARKLPFGIAQIGKAFRNEITPGNFIFRTREFEQMEIEFFIKPPQFAQEGEKNDEQWHDEWIEQRFKWWQSLGIDASRLRKREQSPDELAHYAKRTVDIEYLFPGSLGWGEIEGVANRTDYDLTAHSKDIPEEDLKRLKLEPNKDSVEKFDYFDPDAKARYIPWVIEPSAGATRAMLTVLCEAYDEELVKEPPEADVQALRDEIPAVVKNAQKKAKAANAAPGKMPDAGAGGTPALQRKHDPAAIAAFCEALEDAANRLPQSLLELESLLDEHPGAQNLEPVKKLKPRVSKLAEDCARVVLRLKPALAPVKLAVFPLKKNKPELVEIARKIKRECQPHFRTVYDDSAGIGKLYRRQDEIGTPFCVTVDFDTLEDGTVTVRDRDTMGQDRVKVEDLRAWVQSRL